MRHEPGSIPGRWPGDEGDVLAFGVVVSEQERRPDRADQRCDLAARGLTWRGLSNQLAVCSGPCVGSRGRCHGLAVAQRNRAARHRHPRALRQHHCGWRPIAATFARFPRGPLRLAGSWPLLRLSVRGLATAAHRAAGRADPHRHRGADRRRGRADLPVSRASSRGAGGFATPMALLGDVASEVWDPDRPWGLQRLARAANGDVLRSEGRRRFGHADAPSRALSVSGNMRADTFRGGLTRPIRAIWGLLPAAIGDLGFQAANSLTLGPSRRC